MRYLILIPIALLCRALVITLALISARVPD
jgi:hypothetical protein